MTIASNLTKHTYSGNGAQKLWPYTFPIVTADGSDIKVYLTTVATGAVVEVTSNYTVNTANKQVTYPVTGDPLTSSYKITLLRVEGITQETDLVNQGPFLAEVIETVFDKLTAIDQQQQEQLNRAIKIPVSTAGIDIELPTPVALHSFRWNATGNGLETTLDPATVVESATAQKVLAETARTGSEAARDISVAARNEAQRIQTEIGQEVKNVALAEVATIQADITASKNAAAESATNASNSAAAAAASAAATNNAAPKGVYATLAALQAAYPTGTTGIYLVTADGKWYYWDGSAWTAGGTYQSTGIADGSISAKKMNNATVDTTANLFDKTQPVTYGYYLTSSGVLSANASLDLTDYIEIEASTPYIASHVYAYIGCYDSSKNLLSMISAGGSGAVNVKFTTPSNAKYIRIDLQKASVNYDTYMLIKGSTMPGVYVPYTVKVNWLKSFAQSVNYDALDTTVTSRFMTIDYTTNLFDINSITVGKVVTNVNGETTNTNYSVSDYITVSPNTQYTINYADAIFCACFDATKTFISAINTTATNYTFTTPANTAYIRINILNTHKEYCLLVLGSSIPSGFIPYGGTNKKLLYKDASKWWGKKIATFGDSITWYDGNNFLSTHTESGTLCKGYQYYIRKKLQCSTSNQGVSGNEMPDINTRIKAFNFTGIDAVTITSGANDFRMSPSKVGSIASIGGTFDTTTYYGALQDAIEYILTGHPTMKIYLLTPVKGWSGVSSIIMPETYPEAIIAVGKLYSLPVCDWYHTSGISRATMMTYMGDLPGNGYYLHPTNAGFSRMADILVPFLENN